jgi:hypothetical protein
MAPWQQAFLLELLLGEASFSPAFLPQLLLPEASLPKASLLKAFLLRVLKAWPRHRLSLIFRARHVRRAAAHV